MPETFRVVPKTCNIAIYPPGATFGPRRLRDYELVWIIEGHAQYRRQLPDGTRQTHDAPPGAVVLCRPGVTDSFIWDPHRTTRHGFVHFDLAHRPRHWPPQRDWPMVRILEPGDIFIPMFRHLLAWSKLDPIMSGLTLSHMLTAFLRGRLTTARLPATRLPDPVERAMRCLYALLDADSAAPIRFDDMVRASGVTPSHLCRLFRKSVGRTPAQTIKLTRLDRAAAMLFHSNYSIKEIAHLCGFSTPFLFSRQYKQAYGLSPLAMRRQTAAGRTPPLPPLQLDLSEDQ